MEKAVHPAAATLRIVSGDHQQPLRRVNLKYYLMWHAASAWGRGGGARWDARAIGGAEGVVCSARTTFPRGLLVAHARQLGAALRVGLGGDPTAHKY